MASMEWNDVFMTLVREATVRYHERPQMPACNFFLPAEVEFLAEIGYTPDEMHAYIQDYATKGDPSPSTILLIAAARRNFFLISQRGISGNAKPVRAADLPSPDDDYQGIPYLPRIICKADAKLHGTLDKALMFYDEQDRQFLREHGNIHPADFLQLVSRVNRDRQKIVKAVMQAMKIGVADDTPARPATTTPQRRQDPASWQPIQSELNLD